MSSFQRDIFSEKCEWLPEIEIDGFRISEGLHLAGKSIAELQVRKKTGVTIIAVRRSHEVFTNPEPDFRFRVGDIILFTGERKKYDEGIGLFQRGGIMLLWLEFIICNAGRWQYSSY